MKILFIGCVESSYRLLERLIYFNKNVVGVITKEKSEFNSDFFDLYPFCEDNKIPVHYTANINDTDCIDFIKELEPDIGFCFGWSQLLKENIIRLFPQGIVGFHPAALPQNRGRHPLIWALALGLKNTASTFFMIDAGADEGDIISQKIVPINYEDDARTLYDKVMKIAVDQEIELVEALEKNKIQRIHQVVNEGNSWRKRGKSDGEIDWRMSSRSIYNLVRSLTKPYIGAHFIYKGKEYKVWKVEEIKTLGFENIEPGKVLSINENKTIDIKTGENGIRLIKFDNILIEEEDYIL